MKMKRRYFIAAMLLFAGAVLTTGCKKDEAQRFRLTIADQGGRSKTTLVATEATYHTLWQNDDAIYINGMNNLLNVQGVGSGNGVYAVSDVDISAVDGKYYAFYGGRGTNISSDFSANPSYSFTMPSSYTYSATDLHSPLAGVGSGSGDVTIVFQNLFALLELEVPMASSSNPYTIIITDVLSGGMPLYGNYTATYTEADGWTTVSGSTVAENELQVTKSTPETKVYIPIPAGNHRLDIYVNSLCSITQKTLYNFKAGRYYKINTMKTIEDALPEDVDLVAYPFPVDGNNVAFFGKGNLRFDNQNYTGDKQWGLESEQWSVTPYVVGSNNMANQSSHFCWLPEGGSVNPLAQNNRIPSGELDHEGYSKCFDPGHASSWLLPTRQQWENILGLSAGAQANWAYVRIADNTVSGGYRNGMLVIPSGITLPTITGVSIVKGKSDYTNWTQTPALTAEQFLNLEKNCGCIFLPAGGGVAHSGSTGTWSGDNIKGSYRTATRDGNKKSVLLTFTVPGAPTFTSGVAFGDGAQVRMLYIGAASSK